LGHHVSDYHYMKYVNDILTIYSLTTMAEQYTKYLCKIITEELCYKAEILLAHLSRKNTAENQLIIMVLNITH